MLLFWATFCCQQVKTTSKEIWIYDCFSNKEMRIYESFGLNQLLRNQRFQWNINLLLLPFNLSNWNWLFLLRDTFLINSSLTRKIFFFPTLASSCHFWKPGTENSVTETNFWVNRFIFEDGASQRKSAEFYAMFTHSDQRLWQKSFNAITEATLGPYGALKFDCLGAPSASSLG